MTKDSDNGKISTTEVAVLKTASENLFTIVGKEVFSLQNIIQYDKPFLDYEKLIALMESRNIIISNHDFAKKALSNISYYTLVNGYKNTFCIDESTEQFLSPIKFEELYTLHTIDTSLNSLLLKNILMIEHSLKSKISYTISKNYGVYTDVSDLSNMSEGDYLNCSNYSSISARNNILRSLKLSLTDNNRNNIIKHYETTKNHIPPWILTTTISFGLSIKWYTILKSNDKEYICNAFIENSQLSISDKKEFLIQSLKLLREYRNIIAHGNRTFSNLMRSVIPKKQILLLSNNILTESEYNSGLGQKDLMAIILIISILLNDCYMTTNFIADLKHIFHPYLEISFSDKTIFEVFGLPDNFFDRIKYLQ